MQKTFKDFFLANDYITVDVYYMYVRTSAWVDLSAGDDWVTIDFRTPHHANLQKAMMTMLILQGEFPRLITSTGVNCSFYFWRVPTTTLTCPLVCTWTWRCSSRTYLYDGWWLGSCRKNVAGSSSEKKGQKEKRRWLLVVDGGGWLEDVGRRSQTVEEERLCG